MPIVVLPLLVSGAGADILFDVPPEARGRLDSHVARHGALSAAPERLIDGRRADCWVFGLEPGDDAVVTVTSRDFAPVLEILPAPVCTGRAVLYSDADVANSPHTARVRFETDVNAWGVRVSGAAPEALGRYRITFRAELSSPPAVRSISAPEQIVRSLYDPADEPDLGDPAVIDRVFAPAVAEALKTLIARTDGLGLGFDPLVDGQDSDLTTPDIQLSLRLNRSALVEVRFLNMGHPVHLVMHMREFPGAWRVEDIESRTPDGDLNWVLSRLLGLDLGVAAARQD